MDKWIIANWKMNGSRSFAEKYMSEMAPNFMKSQNNIVLCPPFPLLPLLHDLRGETKVHLGAQNCYFHESGAFTGEVSPALLADLSCKFVILGHSERRTHFHETSEVVALKAELAQKHNLTPIICVGESLNDREEGLAQAFVIDQINRSLPKGEAPFMLAYEPIWAIGTGRTATNQDIEEMHGAIRAILPSTPLLYGGSVNSQNSAEILSLKDVDGVLVGGASLKAEEFSKMMA